MHGIGAAFLRRTCAALIGVGLGLGAAEAFAKPALLKTRPAGAAAGREAYAMCARGLEWHRAQVMDGTFERSQPVFRARSSALRTSNEGAAHASRALVA